ncbi:class I SAM-dependent methyltransferase [Flindersiella endophytica]
MPPEPSGAQLRATFDAAAATYQDARPDYPTELYDDLLELTGLQPPADLLEIGPGPGKATLPLARRGFRITAIELGADLAQQARHNLAAFPGVSVVTTPFEEWKAEDAYDLAYAATAWHWIDQDVKYANAAAVLRPGGHLAVWGAGHAFPKDFDPFFTEIQQVYDEIGEGLPGDQFPPPLPEEVHDSIAGELEASGQFEVVGVRRYVWGLRYTADQYLALLDTFSGHIAMDRAKRDRLYGEVRRRLGDRPDNSLIRHWMSTLTVGRVINP